MKYRLTSQGYIKIGQLLLIALLLLVTIPLAKPYVRYYALLWHTNIVVKANVGNSRVMRNDILSYSKKKNIPLLGRDLTFTKEGKRVKVQLSWIDKVDYFGFYQTPLKFVINDEY